MQLLCLVGMEAPVSYQADEIRNKKVDVLRRCALFCPNTLFADNMIQDG